MTEFGLFITLFFLLCYWCLAEAWEISKTCGGTSENPTKSIRDFEKARKAVEMGRKKNER